LELDIWKEYLMRRYRKLHAADQNEIEALASRVQKLIGRRKFATAAAVALAFSIPASMVTVVPFDALAAGSGGGMMKGGMVGMM
jgi:hypothetical protein